MQQLVAMTKDGDIEIIEDQIPSHLRPHLGELLEVLTVQFANAPSNKETMDKVAVEVARWMARHQSKRSFHFDELGTGGEEDDPCIH